MSQWYKLRGKTAPKEEFVPDIGFIEPGVAAGFLIQTDIPYAIIDLYISNPRSEKAIRDEALDRITQMLFQKAKSLGCKVVRCESQVNTIKERAERNGFKPVGDFALFVKEL